MTDEEKAYEYYEDNECYSYLSEIEEFKEFFDLVKDIVTETYIAGLAEGRKESGKDIDALTKENAELKEKLEKEQNLNKVIKERLVEVNCDCNAEKKEKCVMFPEYCEGERKTVVDLMSLVSDGLNESLIKQKDEQIEVKKLEILELKEQLKNLKGENEVLNSANKQLNSLIKIKDECAREYIEQIEKMKCPSCIWRDEKALYPTTDEAEHIICDECKNHSKWELAQ